ncbi:MAG: hypothetical protein RIB60_09370 [Phycisphaerales bacterium]
MADTTRVSYWLIGIYGVLFAVTAAAVVYGVVEGDREVGIAGALGLVVTLAAAPVAWFLQRGAGGEDDGELARAAERVEAAVREMTEVGALSDDARRVLNRGRERDLLRRAIEEDIASEDWDAAMVLVKELAERFGYRSDAEGFRARIETARYQTQDRRVAEAVAGLDGLITQRRWEDARAEAERITRLFPDSMRVEGLRHRVESARERLKVDLERRFLKAAEEDRIDEAMALLNELDQYLTEAEAAPYQEVARGVIGKARENLGVQFKLAIHDRAWDDAASVGERIIESFPNSRMADEIRGMIDELRDRAQAMRS